MWRKSKLESPKSDFKSDIPEYGDDEIIEILKKRDYYQSEAVELAKTEAKERGLIQSEQDLYGEEFRAESMQFELFPTINDSKNKSKIRKSIARGVLITGVLPTVWGFLQINEGSIVEGSLLLTSGVLWIIFAAGLIRQANSKMIYGLMVLSALSVIYVAKILLQISLVFMDLFIVILLYSLLIYGLIFLKKLR